MKSLLQFFLKIIFPLLPPTRLFSVKVFLLNAAGYSIHKSVRIGYNLKVFGNGKLIVKSNTWLGHETFLALSDASIIEIEENVDIAPRVYIGTGTHEINKGENIDRAAGKGIYKNVKIKKGTWVGANSTILPGVTIGEYCVIAAGSVVASDVPDRTIYGGVPAKFLKNIDE